MKKIFRLIVLLLLQSAGEAYASADYHLTFNNLSRYYNIVISPPEGNYPNSVCMETWYLPASSYTLSVGSKPLKITIRDKNGAGCGGGAKYNTWKVTAQPISGYENYLVTKLCYIKFYHDSHPVNVWKTTIYTTINKPTTSQDNDVLCHNTNSNHFMLSSAQCNEYDCFSQVSQSGENPIVFDFFGNGSDVNLYGSCRDRKAASLDGYVIGLYPTWGGSNLNRMIIQSLNQRESYDVTFPYDLTTAMGKSIFKSAMDSMTTYEAFRVTCDGNGNVKGVGTQKD